MTAHCLHEESSNIVFPGLWCEYLTAKEPLTPPFLGNLASVVPYQRAFVV